MITNVSMTQFSIARHFGGITFQKKPYRYFAETDALIRDDVVRWLELDKKQKQKQTKPQEQKEML
jgi:hypothetical protein